MPSYDASHSTFEYRKPQPLVELRLYSGPNSPETSAAAQLVSMGLGRGIQSEFLQNKRQWKQLCDLLANDDPIDFLCKKSQNASLFDEHGRKLLGGVYATSYCVCTTSDALTRLRESKNTPQPDNVIVMLQLYPHADANLVDQLYAGIGLSKRKMSTRREALAEP